MTVWEIVENEVCECPGLTLDMLPATLPQQLSIFKSSNALSLKPVNITGTISLENGMIRIVPKIRTLDPLEMMLYLSIEDFDVGEVKSFGLGEPGISLSSIGKQFVHLLESIGHLPRMVERNPQHVFSRAVTGRVNWRETALRMRRGFRLPISTIRSIASPETPENILIALACRELLDSGDWSESEEKLLLSWATGVRSRSLTRRQVLELRASSRTKNFGGPYGFYRGPVSLGLIILGLDGVGVSDRISGSASVVNSPALFENFVRTALMRVAGQRELIIRKDFMGPAFMFETDLYRIEPDVTLYSGNDLLALADVKYKAPDSGDLYQMYSYLKYAELSRGSIFSPFVEDGRVMRSFDGLEIVFHQVKSSNPNDINLVARRYSKEFA